MTNQQISEGLDVLKEMRAKHTIQDGQYYFGVLALAYEYTENDEMELAAAQVFSIDPAFFRDQAPALFAKDPTSFAQARKLLDKLQMAGLIPRKQIKPTMKPASA